MIKYFYLIIFTTWIFNCSENVDSKQKISVKEEINSASGQEILTLEEKLKDEQINKIYQIAERYLTYDFLGARLRADHPYHDLFFNKLWGINEGTSEMIWVVDTVEIKDINTKEKDSLYVVIIEVYNPIEIDPIYNTFSKLDKKLDSLFIRSGKIISGNQAYIGRKPMYNYFKDQIKRKDWSKERIETIENEIFKY